MPTDDCPRCAAPGRIVTAVTVRPLGSNPRSVLVTLFCTNPACAHKYTVLKAETALAPAERALWHDP